MLARVGQQLYMTRTLIENCCIWREDELVVGNTLVIADGRVQAVSPASELAAQPGDRRVDGAGAFLLPGFVDAHVHGGNNFDVMDGDEAALQGLCDFLARHGVTSFLATTMADSRARIDAALTVMRGFVGRANSNCVGLHLEGPYLNPAFRGSQPAVHLRLPNPDEYRPWLDSGLIKQITLAPELPGADELMRAARERGIRLSIGHSGASYEATQNYIAAGCSQITHTFNGMAGIHHRQPGIFVAASEHPSLRFEIIPDGVHVHPAVVRMLVRLVGSERVLAVTDAMRAAGLSDGRYGMGDVAVIVKDGIARDQHGSLAGSTLTMEAALRNMMRFCDMTLAEALPMLTRVPAKSIGLYPRKGSLRIGADADLVFWDEERGVMATFIGGKCVYRRGEPCTAATADG